MFKTSKTVSAIVSLLVILGLVIFYPSASIDQKENSPTQQPGNAQIDSSVLGVIDDRGFEAAVITRVIDGDTVELSDGRKVRYIGIDTPETKHPTKGVQCWGKEASARNIELVEGKTVWLEQDVNDTDRYGRLLRYVWVSDQMINHQLVVEGFAFASSYPPDVAHQDLFAEAEKIARENNHGLWESCPLNDVDSINETIEKIDAAVNAGECIIKGNISSSGKLYHLPGCSSYNATVISVDKGERWFCSGAEAEAAGWVKSGSC